LAVCIALPLLSQGRGNIVIPDLKGYVTLKCDFHMHTVFSDGTVWPTVRVDEAFREGIDAISLTEHLESRRYLQDMEKMGNISIRNLSHNISYALAQTYAKDRGIMLIRGAEITRSMPPGHHNAIFITDADKLATPEYMDAFRAAKAQNAFIFWNHPGWVSQQPDTTLWFNEHTQLLQQGMMHGIVVVNGPYYPEVHRWCLEKKLTLIGASDAHGPIAPYAPGKHRTMTLVFARERTPESIHEALKERRTAVYHENFVIGEEKYLKELFENALEITVTKTENTASITIKNKSDLIFHLRPTNHDARLTYLRNINLQPFTIAPQGAQTISVRLNGGIKGGDVNISVENFLVEPEKGMRYTIKI
jgi:phosphoribosyl-ATP pyrophosphohydrolase